MVPRPFLFAAVIFVTVFSVLPSRAQSGEPSKPHTFAPAPAPAPPAGTDTRRPKVFITASQSWESRGAGGGSGGSGGGGFAGGARPQTAEIIKTFGERCPQVQINNREELVDYIVELDHEGGKSVFAHKDKVAVFDRRSGDSIGSKSTLSVGGSVDSACAAILAHWAAHSADIEAEAAQETRDQSAARAAPAAAAVVAPVSAAASHLTITSEPAGADIEIDGAFVGNTPSTIDEQVGEKEVSVTKKGYVPWKRKVKLTGGDIHVSAELEAVASK